MTTVRDILTDALVEIGAIDPGEAISAGDAASMLRLLNRMIDSLNTEDLMIYTVDRTVFNLVGGQQFYTIGVGGNFVTTYAVRPGQIDMASILVAGSTVEIPIDVLNDEQWRDITVKATPSSYPLAVWANGNYPLNTLAFWPVPQGAYQVVLYLWGQVASFPDVNATITLPQGYEDFLVSTLAVRAAPQYSKQPSAVTVQMAKDSKARIKKMNWEPTYRSADGVFRGSKNSIGQKSRGYVID